MLFVGNGVFLRYQEGVSKKGFPYKLIELGGNDFKKCTVNVPDDLVPTVASLNEGDNVTASISFESGFSGLRGDLKLIQKK